MELLLKAEHDPRAEMVRRLKLYTVLRNDPDSQAMQLAMCKRDVFYFFENFLWTYDPRNLETPYLPFILFPHQERLLQALVDLEAKGTGELIVVKSRDQGATEICTGYAVHRWRFKTMWSGLFGSNLERSVDHLKNPKAIFHKVRSKIDNLPHWLTPQGYLKRRHDNYLAIVNPANAASITGEAGDNIGRGDRKTWACMDESAFLERPEEKDAALLRTANMKVHISTPHGNSNPFYFKAHNKAYTRVDLFWKDDPRYNTWQYGHWGPGGKGTFFCVYETGGGFEPGSGYGPRAWQERTVSFAGEDLIRSGELDLGEGLVVRWPWYDEQKALMAHAPHLIAQELDMDFAASVTGLCIPARWVEAAVKLPLPPRPYALVCGLDIAGGGENSSVLAFRRGPLVERVESWDDRSPSSSVLAAANMADEAGASHLNYDAAGIGIDADSTLARTGRSYRFQRHGVNGGDAPTEKVWPDKRTSQDLFKNLRAEDWWSMRLRFQRTWEFVNLGVQYPPEDLISIPDDALLKTQFAGPKVFEGEDGKIYIEKKEKMAERGVPSPDRAEAVILAFADHALGGAYTAVTSSGGPAQAQATQAAERVEHGKGVPLPTKTTKTSAALTPAQAQAKAMALARQNIKPPGRRP